MNHKAHHASGIDLITTMNHEPHHAFGISHFTAT
jgi:hypothetical protein